MRMLIGAVSLALLAGCVSSAMNEARNQKPFRVLMSDKPTPLVAQCVQFAWQDEAVYGVDASGYMDNANNGRMTVYTRGAESVADLQPQGTGTNASYYAAKPDDSVALRRLAALATCL